LRSLPIPPVKLLDICEDFEKELVVLTTMPVKIEMNKTLTGSKL